MPKHFMSRHPVLSLLTGTGTVAAIAAGATFALGAVGFPDVSASQTDAIVTKTGTGADTASWSPTPASKVLASTLTGPPPGWERHGGLQHSVAPPFPYSCPLPGMAASTALGQSYNANGHRIQVITLAYTAGLGAEAMRQQTANAYVCAGGEPISLGALYGQSPGVESAYAGTGKGDAVVSSRRGDVLTFVTGRPGSPLQDLANTFDRQLKTKLSPVCADPSSTAADAARSPFSNTGYEPFTRTKTVAIRDVDLPEIPKDRKKVKEVPIPAPGLVAAAAYPVDQPAYPVWPPMPEPLALPELPEAPASNATTEQDIQVPVADKTGPGCGWAFTGMDPLTFDAAAAAKTTERKTNTVRELLLDAADTWQRNVLGYWTGYATYRQDAGDYDEYRERVTEVNAVWASIGAEWDQYNADLAAYEARVAEREAFLAEQDQAGEAHQRQLKICRAPVPDPEPVKTVEPSPEPEPSEAPEDETGGTPADEPDTEPTEEPPLESEPVITETPAPRPGCPAERPAILDEEAPDAGTPPTKPEDPAP